MVIRNIDELRGLWAEKTHRELKRLSELAGVPYGTTVRIVKGYTKHPRVDTFQKLADVANQQTAA
jgi:predicted transcriptional regulator